MDNGGIEEGWKPSPPPEKGSPRWKDDIAFQMALAALPGGFPLYNIIVQLPDYEGHYLGWFCVRKLASGWDYFRSETFFVFSTQEDGYFVSDGHETENELASTPGGIR